MNQTLKKILAHVLTWSPVVFVVYFFPLLENPDALTTLYAFQDKGKEFLLVEGKFEETNENSSGRTTHSYSKKILVMDLESQKIITRHNLDNVDLLKGSGPLLWDFDYGDKGLYVFNILDGKIRYTQNELYKISPSIKTGITKCSQWNNEWTLSYKDGSVAKFNDTEILPLLNTAQYYIPLPNYTKQWDIAPSSGSRSSLVYKGRKSAQDLLAPTLLYDNYTGTLLSTPDGKECLVQSQQEVGGDYYLGLADAKGDFRWYKKSRDLIFSSSTYNLVGIGKDRVLLVTKSMVTCVNMLTGEILWKASLRNDGIPFMWGIIGIGIWLIIVYSLLYSFTKLDVFWINKNS